MTLTSTLSPIASLDVTDWKAVASIIDHTLLKTEATRQEVEQLCGEAIEFGFATVFVHPAYTAVAADLLHGTDVEVGTPVGFPLGTNLTSVKRYEAEEALKLGAREIDMVINVGALRSGERERVEIDIASVVEVVHASGAILKVILETHLLDLQEKILACELAQAAGADFVKTSTGWFGGGATIEDVALMRGVVGDRMKVKASGGIRTAAAVAEMVHAGADRIGTSTGVQIVHELRG